MERDTYCDWVLQKFEQEGNVDNAYEFARALRIIFPKTQEYQGCVQTILSPLLDGFSMQSRKKIERCFRDITVRHPAKDFQAICDRLNTPLSTIQNEHSLLYKKLISIGVRENGGTLLDALSKLRNTWHPLNGPYGDRKKALVGIGTRSHIAAMENILLYRGIDAAITHTELELCKFYLEQQSLEE